MRLAQLLEALPQKQSHGDLNVEVSGLAHDSRLVKPGDLFVAIKGLETDGHRFIPEAIERGAIAITVEEARYHPPSASHRRPASILVPDSRQALAHLAAAFHGHPARKLRVIGVTGTDGKTTTVHLIQAILTAAGYKADMINTIYALVGNRRHDTGLHTTTPDALEMQSFLAQMVAAGTEYAVLESTSHGLTQHRVAACEYDVAVITNVTHEHLDYHGSYESYLEAKARLFRYLATSFRKPDTPKVSILNADDPSFTYLRGISADVQLTYGLTNPGDVTATEVRHGPSFTTFVAHTPQGQFEVRTSLLGSFNVYNILAAVAVGISQNLPFEAMQSGIASLNSILGRMERIDVGQDFTVIIDFAHTPNGLEQALEAVRGLTEGKVIVLFGCTGLRDMAKRPVMGEIAGRLADRVIITADDTRTEPLEDIMAQIATGCEAVKRREGEDYWRIGDRREAIAFATNMARTGDLILFACKGHERSILLGTTEYPWSEHEVVISSLKKRLAKEQPPGNG